MSLGRKFLSRKFSKSFRELNRRTEEEEERERAAAVEASPDDYSGPPHGTTWGTILPELLGEIIQRVEATEDRWQRRRNIVACAGVCNRWRDITKETFSTHLNSGLITFPSCLKQPGPSDSSHQCLIRRNRKNSTFYLYLALSPSLTDKGKFLLAAKRYRHAAHIEYIISLNADDYSQGSNAYVGKLCSDFLGTNFTVYDSEAPHSGARPSNARAGRRFASKQISPQVSAGNFEVGNVSYKFNLLKSRGPRRMVCSLRCQNSSSSGESSPSPNNRIDRADDNRKMKKKSESSSSSEYMVLRNKAPRWHEHLQCWCLNFHGRVSVASVKNFQLVAAVDQTQSPGKGDDETVLLQFGKVGDNLFTMDYRQPLSAFMAFAICLTSFGTKIACE